MARKMKDSGIDWIGEIPEGWEVVQLKRFAEVHNGREIDVEVDSTDSSAVGVYGSGGVFKYTNRAQYSGKAVLFGRKGTLGKPLYVEGQLWAVDTMYFLTYSNRLLEKFSYYQFLAFNWAPYITHTAIPSVVASEIVACYFPIPPLEEQAKIADYLDNGCASLDTILDKTRSSIEEYKKLKQAVITQAVTKGVRGEREMKDSGVEWIGEIPKEWDILNLVAHTSMLTLMRDRPENLDGPIPWIRIEDFDGKYISSSKASLGVSKETVRSMNLKIYPVGTILCTSSCIMGKCAIVSRELVSNQRFIGIIPDQNTCENFLYYLMLSNSERMNYLATGALQANLSRSSFEHLKVQFPSYQEQKEISDYLDTKCAEIDKLIAKKEQLVKELESYKKSLIYEIVTGKREV